MKQRLVIAIGILLSLITLVTLTIIGVYRALSWRLKWLPIDALVVNISQPIEWTQRLVELNSETIANASEIATLPHPTASTEVVEMIQASEDGSLLVVYGDGMFRRWDLNTLESVAEFDFLAASPRGVNFSADGSLVITPGFVVAADELLGYTVWNTLYGEIVDCIGPHCPVGWSRNSLSHAGFGLTPNGRWIIEYVASLLNADGLQLRISGMWDIDPNPYNTSDHTISRVAFDRTGTYLAGATEEDEVWVFDVDNLFNPEGLTNEDIIAGRSNAVVSYPFDMILKHRRYGSYHPDAHTNTVDLAFDDTRTWLAQLTDRDLLVWDLRREINSRRLSMGLDGGTALTFNHAGDLLAMGTSKGIVFVDLESKKQIISFTVEEVTALYFSLDDRLLLWGDPDGDIHLWGVTQNP